jgi:Cu2+-exporting ATPase
MPCVAPVEAALMPGLATQENHGRSNPHAGHQMTDDQGAHDRHGGHSVAMFRDKFWFSFALTIPVIIWSSDVQGWAGLDIQRLPSPDRG